MKRQKPHCIRVARPRWAAIIGLCLATFLTSTAHSATGVGILDSKHDLSVSGPGPAKALSESEVCLFCHTPHRAVSQTPLWNHRMSEASYTPYTSSTTKAAVGQPTGSSKLCLSCHDGTVALGMLHTRSSPIEMRDGLTTMPPGRANLRICPTTTRSHFITTACSSTHAAN